MPPPMFGQTNLRIDNPYIVGRPIYEPEHFFGRKSLFDFIRDNLQQEAQVILLHGQRRIGKSSVLAQIPNFVQLERFVFVGLSLEGKSQKSLGEVLYDLAGDISHHLIDELHLPKSQIQVSPKASFQENTNVFTTEFLLQVYAALGQKNLVLLLDEFDVMGDHQPNAAVNHFFPYLQEILLLQKRLFIIPVVGRRLDDMPNLLGLFRTALTKEIGLLDRRSVEQLITKPAESILTYEPDTIDAILDLTAGHPFFTQLVCFALFAKAREEEQWQVTRGDVEAIVERAIELGEAGLNWFYDGLFQPERLIFSAIAEIQQQKLSLDLWELLQEQGGVQTQPLIEARSKLLELGFLKNDAASTSGSDSRTDQVTVEIVQRWLIKHHPIAQEVRLYELTTREQFLLLQEGVEKWNQWISKNLDVKIDLSGCDFSGFDLSGVNLSKANLSGINFSRTNLAGSDLSYANLKRSTLTGVNLSKANLESANLENSTLSIANLSQANLSGANLYNVKLQFAKLTGAILSHVNLDGARLRATDLIGADLRHSDLRRSDLLCAKLNRANLEYANLDGVELSGADLSQANLNYVNLSGAKLVAANLSNATLNGVNLTRANLSDANLENSNLAEVRLSRSYLSSANLRNTNLINSDLQGANLLAADLSGANLKNTSLTRAYLSNAYLTQTDLRGVDLRGADLTMTKLSTALVQAAQFEGNVGLSDLQKLELQSAGAIVVSYYNPVNQDMMDFSSIRGDLDYRFLDLESSLRECEEAIQILRGTVEEPHSETSVREKLLFQLALQLENDFLRFKGAIQRQKEEIFYYFDNLSVKDMNHWLTNEFHAELDSIHQNILQLRSYSSLIYGVWVSLPELRDNSETFAEGGSPQWDKRQVV
jgi:uncharacterized protein YjbI with pentapeptide repeats